MGQGADRKACCFLRMHSAAHCVRVRVSYTMCVLDFVLVDLLRTVRVVVVDCMVSSESESRSEGVCAGEGRAGRSKADRAVGFIVSQLLRDARSGWLVLLWSIAHSCHWYCRQYISPFYVLWDTG